MNFLDDDSPFEIDLVKEHIDRKNPERIICGEKLAKNFVAQRAGKYQVSTDAWPIGWVRKYKSLFYLNLPNIVTLKHRFLYF